MGRLLSATAADSSRFAVVSGKGEPMGPSRLPGPLALHEGALDATSRVIARLRPEHLALPTPCDEWDVRLLIEHLIAGNDMFARAVTGGASGPSVGDPFEDYARSTEAVRQAWREPGAMDRDVTVAFGTFPGHAAVRMHFVDHLVHGWDLAKATGQGTTIDPLLAIAAYEEMTAALDPSSRGPGMPFAPEVPCSSDAPVDERLVAFLGRQP